MRKTTKVGRGPARRRIWIGAALAAAALAAVGGAMAAMQSPSNSQSAHAARASVGLRKTSAGKILVDASGRTLYMYTVDHGTTSACYSGCAPYWPPLMTKGAPRAIQGAHQALLGTTARKSGGKQVTYKGHPLYTYTGDSKAGEFKGQGYSKTWYVLSASGAVIKGKVSSGSGTSTPPPSTTTSGGGSAWG
jgi:predicted lipoprotein with Yx(FWY)xxD motif